jgi:hypothetical protein
MVERVHELNDSQQSWCHLPLACLLITYTRAVYNMPVSNLLRVFPDKYHTISYNETSVHSAVPWYFSRTLNATLTAAAKYRTKNVIFLTITASSAYSAVQALGGPSSVDAIPRVFEVIRQAVYADLIAGNFCPPGKRVKADYALNVNEWQKRGLPHAHMIAHFSGPMWTPHEVRTLPVCSAENFRIPVNVTFLVPHLQPRLTDTNHEGGRNHVDALAIGRGGRAVTPAYKLLSDPTWYTRTASSARQRVGNAVGAFPWHQCLTRCSFQVGSGSHAAAQL